jgi:hypothetical protein
VGALALAVPLEGGVIHIAGGIMMNLQTEWKDAKLRFEKATGSKKPDAGFFSHASGIDGALQKIDAALAKDSLSEAKSALDSFDKAALAYASELKSVAGKSPKGPDFVKQVKALQANLESIVTNANVAYKDAVHKQAAAPNIRPAYAAAEAASKVADLKLAEMAKHSDEIATALKVMAHDLLADGFEKAKDEAEAALKLLPVLNKAILAASAPAIATIDKFGKSATPELRKIAESLHDREAKAAAHLAKAEGASKSVKKAEELRAQAESVVKAYQEVSAEAKSWAIAWNTFLESHQKGIKTLREQMNRLLLSGTAADGKKLLDRHAELTLAYNEISKSIDSFLQSYQRKDPRNAAEQVVKMAPGVAAASSDWGVSVGKVVDIANKQRSAVSKELTELQNVLTESFKTRMQEIQTLASGTEEMRQRVAFIVDHMAYIKGAYADIESRHQALKKIKVDVPFVEKLQPQLEPIWKGADGLSTERDMGVLNDKINNVRVASMKAIQAIEPYKRRAKELEAKDIETMLPAEVKQRQTAVNLFIDTLSTVEETLKDVVRGSDAALKISFRRFG